MAAAAAIAGKIVDIRSLGGGVAKFEPADGHRCALLIDNIDTDQMIRCTACSRPMRPDYGAGCSPTGATSTTRNQIPISF